MDLHHQISYRVLNARPVSFERDAHLIRPAVLPIIANPRSALQARYFAGVSARFVSNTRISLTAASMSAFAFFSSCHFLAIPY